MSATAVAETPPKRAGELILEVACEEFYRQGIRAVGVDEVVTRAGYTKPSLYRAFGSKEGLIGAYLQLREAELWRGWDEAAARHPHDPRAQLMDWLGGLTKPGARGCGLSNAAVEFPETGHPARLAVEAAKAELRRRLRDLVGRIGAADPDRSGDGLLLLVEGALISGQLFGEDGPARALVQAAEAVIGAAPAIQLQPPAEAAPKPPKPVRAKLARQPAGEFQPMLF